MSKLFLDTNVLVYGIDEDSRFFSQARSLIGNPNNELYTSSKNLIELLSVTTRGPNAPLKIQDALSVMDDYASALSILFPNPQSLVIFRHLISKYNPAGLKIHDFEIMSIAIANKIQQLATFDTKDFRQVEEIELISF